MTTVRLDGLSFEYRRNTSLDLQRSSKCQSGLMSILTARLSRDARLDNLARLGRNARLSCDARLDDLARWS